MASTAKARAAYAVGIYCATTLAFLLCAAPETLRVHTPYNHFALLAEAWLKGSLALTGPPPGYTGNNDFAAFQGRWFITFPPLPAVILLPFVALAGSAERVRDGAVFLGLAGFGPLILFYALEKLTRLGFSQRNRSANAILALLLGLGSVYFFTAVQGSVWFAAHVVAVVLAASYFLLALGAERPFLAGVMLGFAFLTRTPLLFASALFVVEAYRVCKAPTGARNWPEFIKKLAWFSLPVGLSLLGCCWHNWARFGDPFNFGYEYLQIIWQSRIQRFGLFSYHYLPKNLGVLLTSLPYWTGLRPETWFQINGHGLALWVTTPFYLTLLWNRRRTPLDLALWVTLLLVALPSLFYQNTGWLQFGYRFSNDYAVFLFALLALSDLRFGRRFWLVAACAVALNTFGALSFGRPELASYYDIDPTQVRIYQAD